MFIVTVEFVVEPAAASTFRTRVERQAKDSLKLEPNCYVFDVCVDLCRPERFLLYERYADAEAFDTHLTTDHFLAFDKEVASIVVSKTVQTWDAAVGD